MLAKFDRDFFIWCNQFQQSPEALNLFRFISKTGDGFLYVAIGIVLLLIGGEHNLLFVYTGLVAFAFEVPSFLLLKRFIKRDRPIVTLPAIHQAFEPAGKFSLPSGHSAAAFTMAVTIALFYPPYSEIVLCWASLIAASRVLLGVHYPTDVLAGAALGSCCSFSAMALLGV